MTVTYEGKEYEVAIATPVPYDSIYRPTVRVCGNVIGEAKVGDIVLVLRPAELSALEGVKKT